MQKVLPLDALLNKTSKKYQTRSDTEVISGSLFPFLFILVPAETASTVQGGVCAVGVCKSGCHARDMRPMRMTYQR
jgi:hypothetical protein